MEQAVRIYQDVSAAMDTPGTTPRAETSESIEKVLRFAMPARPGEAEGTRTMSSFTARDFAAAMELVREAAAAIKAADERSREAEIRTHTIAQRAAEELKNAELRIQTLDSRVRAAEARAVDAEARVAEADAWLRQIFSTIAEELPARK